jgi:serine/threonine protein phosphatase 1
LSLDQWIGHFLRRFLKSFLSRDQQPASRARLDWRGVHFDVIYAISDIHGHAAAFEDARRIITHDAQQFPGQKLAVFLGDYVDRGPASRKVLELLMQPLGNGITEIALCGNHDDQLTKMLRGKVPVGIWLQFAGSATLASFGIDVEYVKKTIGLLGLHRLVVDVIPEHYIAKLEAMPVSLQVDNLLFVHAGIRPGIPIDAQTDEDMMWIREPFLERGPDQPVFVIHGHTSSPDLNYGNSRLGIDTAVAATGRLTILKIARSKFTTLRTQPSSVK